MDSVKSGELLVFRVTKLHGIPKSILHDCISGKVLHSDRPGPKPCFSTAEEEEMASF